MNANLESLKKIHGDAAGSVLNEIAQLGGYGDGAERFGGGLDLAGALADSNTELSGSTKDKIAQLAGVTRAQATSIVDDRTGEQSSAHKMRKSKEQEK